MAAEPEAREDFEDCEDRSLYFTLSLYITEQKVTEALGRHLAPELLRAFQPGYRSSKRLRDAVEPLFNDIADRERLGAVDDFLLDTLCRRAGEFLEFTAPAEIEWTTEGRRFIATPPGLDKTRLIRVRRFWYTHANGAIGYHLSFRYNYDHTPGDFYFLSLIQKLAAPKEFAAAPRPPGSQPVRPTDAPTGLVPLDGIKVKAAAGEAQSFWQYVRDVFDADAGDLFSSLKSSLPAGPPVRTIAPRFDQLLSEAPFIEVPGLVMPVSRLMFFFEDKTFFRRLLPEPNPETGKPVARMLMVQEGCYLPFQEKLQGLNPKSNVDVPEVRLGPEYWDWVINRPDYDAYTDAEIEAARKTFPAMEDRRRQDCLHYLFVSGFNQNIIDFMNQDPSEILDSTDPIYPTTEAQAAERKFVRFANPRALITYVEKARSLEAANDFIGTCAYAFMIHAVSMHNEFMTREYEASAFKLLGDVETLGNRGKLKSAAGKFYSFRTGDYAAYYRDRYTNIFRYDTERDVFDSMMKLRGIERRNDYIEKLISNLENQTHDREQRIKQDDESLLTAGLGALGIFGFFQVAFDWADKLKYFANLKAPPGTPSSEGVHFSLVPPFVHLPAKAWITPWDAFSAATLYFSLAATVVGAAFVVYLLLRSRFGNRK
ncbi:hypothetical protein [Hyphomonas sp.]|uniref:hypothetical protein n=1 Tax=Hyphomonas sp. TaxID=87 RepID=UPI0033413271